MSLTVDYYNFSGNPKDVSKNLGTKVGTTSALVPYKPLGSITGEIILGYNATLYECNYCIMDGKHYFITDRERLVGEKMRMILRTDVLSTFSLSDVKVIPVRSASAQNHYIIDTKRPVETRVQHYNVRFTGGANLDYSNMSLIAGIIGSGGQPDNS